MEPHDDDLEKFEAQGAAPLPPASEQGYVDNDGARIWYATYGAGPPVILLHGGLGHSGNWGHQVPALTAAGHRVVLIDSRGHGRSTRDDRPYSYELMASDVVAVMDALRLDNAAFVGWSDGACTALDTCQDYAGAQPRRLLLRLQHGSQRHEAFRAQPDHRPMLWPPRQGLRRAVANARQFQAFVDAVSLMQRTQPNYSANDLAEIRVPVAIVQGENDEFIKPEHAEYLARSIPGAELIILPGVSHFAPLQRPELFNAAVLRFLGKLATS